MSKYLTLPITSWPIRLISTNFKGDFHVPDIGTQFALGGLVRTAQRLGVCHTPDYVLPVRCSMKNAIGTLGRCLSELDISRRRLTLLSWMPLDGKTQEIRASFIATRAFF